VSGRQWTGAGEYTEAEVQVFDRIPNYDPDSKQHLWTTLAISRWAPDTPGTDPDSRLFLQGPDCFYCERPYSVWLAKRACVGRPDDGRVDTEASDESVSD
jgi:hypothetical protein